VNGFNYLLPGYFQLKCSFWQQQSNYYYYLQHINSLSVYP